MTKMKDNIDSLSPWEHGQIALDKGQITLGELIVLKAIKDESQAKEFLVEAIQVNDKNKNIKPFNWDGQLDYAAKLMSLFKGYSVQYLDNSLIGFTITTKGGVERIRLLIDTKDGYVLTITKEK